MTGGQEPRREKSNQSKGWGKQSEPRAEGREAGKPGGGQRASDVRSLAKPPGSSWARMSQNPLLGP